MSSVIFKTIGAAVGNAFLPGIGGAVLGGFAGSLGGMIDAQLGLGAKITGPRLENLSVQDSRYGAGIAKIYGNARVAGNVIWATDLIETSHNGSVGGKGGGLGGGVSTTTYTYSIHCAVAIGAGPLAGINTIWADSTVIYQNGVWTSGLFDAVMIYTGSAGQGPDPFMQSMLGSGAVPAYRGLAYVVFENLQLSSFGNRLPNLTFEIAGAASSTAPEWLGGVDAGVSQPMLGVQSATMPPLVVQQSGAEVQSVIVGGTVASGSTAQFTTVTYDVTQNAPLQLARLSSGSFATGGSVTDSSWAMAPDGRFVALYAQSGASPSHAFVLYDTQTQSFGAVLALGLAASSSIKQIAWLDAQHFVIDDAAGGVRGFHVFARAGSGIVDLGFWPVWGPGSASATMLFYGAQFTQFADGLMAYVAVLPTTGVLNLKACPLAWRNNALSVGTPFMALSGMALDAGSGVHARFVQTAADEWTLAYGTVLNVQLVSFAPSSTGVTVTRPHQTLTFGFGTGTTQAVAFCGDRLVVIHRAAMGVSYLLSEVLVNSGGFALGVTALTVTGGGGLETYFNILRLDSRRLLLMGMGGFAKDLGEVGIIARNADQNLAAIVADILSSAGYAAADFDVSALAGIAVQGYVLSDPMSARRAIEPLQAYAPFDLVESAGQMKAILRGGNAGAVLPASELRAASEDKPQPPAQEILRAQEMDLPREVTVDVIDPSRNFEINSQRARRIATSARSVQKLSLPLVCSATQAKQIAESRLYTAWAERDLVRLSLSRAWAALDPADVLDLGGGQFLRVASVTQSGGLLQVEGFYSYAPGLQSAAAADAGLGGAISAKQAVASVLYMLDLPLLQASDDQAGVYVAATGLTGWKGASLMRSSDGVTYSAVGSVPLACVAGLATSVLGNGSALYPDSANSVTVQLVQGQLASCGWIDLTNGANAALLGSEILQFQNAVLVGPGQYRLSGLLRGRRGTENATGSHALGESFVMLQAGAVTFLPDQLSDRGRGYNFRAIATGQSLSDTQDYAFTYGMKTLCPLSPVNITGTRSNGTTGDLTLTWTRRARLNAEWVDYVDVPLDEPSELYEVDIMNGGNVVRAFTGVTTPSLVYTAVLQTADWGASIPAHFTVNVVQLSARYGKGNAGSAVV